MGPETMTPKEIITQLEDLLKNRSFLSEFERSQKEFTSEQLSELLIGIVEKKVNARINLDIETFKNVVTTVVEFESSTDDVNKMQEKDLARVADRIIFAGKEDQREFNKDAFDIFLEHNNNSPERLTALLKEAVAHSDSYFIDKILKIETTKNLSSEQWADILMLALSVKSQHLTKVFNFAKDKGLLTDQGNINNILSSIVTHNRVDFFKEFAQHVTTEPLVTALKEVVKTTVSCKFEEILNNAKEFISPQHLKKLRKDCKDHEEVPNKVDKLRALDRCIENRKPIKGYMAPILTACGSAAIGAAFFPMVFTALAAGVIGIFIPMAINVAHEKYENFKFEPRKTTVVAATEAIAATKAVDAAEATQEKDSQPSVS
jgi:hypothetical protein